MTGLDWSADRKWTGLDRSLWVWSGPRHFRTGLVRSRSRLRSNMVEKPDWTGLLNTTQATQMLPMAMQMNISPSSDMFFWLAKEQSPGV